MKKTEQEIRLMAEEKAWQQAEAEFKLCQEESCGTLEKFSFEFGFVRAIALLQSHQSEKTVEVEKLREEWTNFWCQSRDVDVSPDATFNWFLPHIQPSGTDEMEAAEFDKWKHDNRWFYSTKNSGSYFELGTENYKSFEELLTEYKTTKQPCTIKNQQH